MTKPTPPPESLPLKETGLTSNQHHTTLACLARSCSEAKPSERPAVISCMRAAFLGAGSSAVTAATNNVAAIIAVTVLSGIVIISGFIVIIIQAWNRDASIIDARARSTILRKWGHKASTSTEIERAATLAILPIFLVREDLGAEMERAIELLQSTHRCRKGNNPSKGAYARLR
jgi:hypothetical protein